MVVDAVIKAHKRTEQTDPKEVEDPGGGVEVVPAVGRVLRDEVVQQRQRRRVAAGSGSVWDV